MFRFYRFPLFDAAPADGGNNQPPATAANTISIAESNALVEKARKEEKTKLFDRISALEADIARLNGIVTEKDTQLAQATQSATEATAALTAIKNAKTANGEVDVKALVSEVSESLKKDLTGAAKASMKELNERLATLEKENKQLKLDQVRAKAIAEAGGPDAVIERLVFGNTPEEIIASAAEAKRVRDEVRQSTMRELGHDPESQNTSNANPNPGTGYVPPVPVVPTSGSQSGAGRFASSASGSVTNVKGMSPREYAKVRDAARATAMNRYVGGQKNPMVGR